MLEDTTLDKAEKDELMAKVQELYANDSFITIIELLEPKVDSLDFDLGLELARSYINAANASAGNSNSNLGPDSDTEQYYLNANALLDRYSIIGKDNATYLFYKGYALFKLGLVNDAALRLERAQRFIRMGKEDKLLPVIKNMLNLCKSLDPDNQNFTLSKVDEGIIDEHIINNFGKYRIIFKTDRYEILNIAPDPERGFNFNLIVTKGLAGRKLNVPAGVDELTNSRIELALCLPAEWEFANSEGYNLWPINVLCELVNYVLTTDEFIGFGYTFSRDKALHPTTGFSGGMLTAMGGYEHKAQEVKLSDNSLVHFFELVFLYPMEIAHRNSHSAQDLLELFRAKQVLPSPVRKRQDVCIEASPVQKI